MNYDSIKRLAKELRVRVTDLLALTEGNDPFYANLPYREQNAHWFVEQWERFGWGAGLHLRRGHYILVSQKVLRPDGTPYLNVQSHWKMFIEASLSARYLKLIPSGVLVDRRNPDPIINAENDTVAGSTIPQPYVAFAAPAFDFELPPDLDLEDELFPPRLTMPGAGSLPDGQPFLTEVWVEKTSQNDILVPLTQRLGVNLVPGAGETSEILARDAIERAIAAERPMRVLYISDFDPGGRSMPVALARKIEWMRFDAGLDLDIQLQPILLLPEQAGPEGYNLLRVPMKDSEKRGARFEENFGEGVVELDALEALHPGELADIVEREVTRYIDPTLTRRAQADYWGIERRLREITERTRARHATALAGLNERYAGTRGELQAAIEAAREELDALEEEAAPLWRSITRALNRVRPEIAADEVTKPRAADEHPEPLYDSRRNYLEQIDHYRQWQRK